MPELEHTPIRQETYDALKQGVRDWIEQDLKWKREDIVSIDIGYQIIKTDASDEEWAKWKHGRNVNVTLKSMLQEKRYQRFIRLDNGDWQKEYDHDVTPFSGKTT